MDTLSLVSKYLNGMEDLLDDGDSLEAKKLTVGKSKEALELFEALDHKSQASHKGFPFPIVMWMSKVLENCRSLDMADSFNYIMEERFDQLGFVRVDYGKNGRKMVINRVGLTFGIEEMHIDLAMLEEMKDIDVMLDAMVENLEEVARLSRDDYGEEVKMRIVKHGLPKKMCDPGNFVLPVKVNKMVEMSALADTGASVSVLPYCLFKNLSLEMPKVIVTLILTISKTHNAKALRRNIPMDKELPLLLGRPFLRTCRVVIDMGHEEEDDWLSCFEVGRDEDGNSKYRPERERADETIIL
ncbi:chlorophyll A/B binding protein of LHCII type 1-like protein [Tanacetum coccineum]